MIIYLTGAPATGKSTLCSQLAKLPNVRHFAYSERLRDHINARTDETLDETDIRRLSAQAVTPADVEAVDQALILETELVRAAGGYLLIDSHPVTKEDYGFRVTPFRVENLLALRPDKLIGLYASPTVLARRIRDDAQGRPMPNEFELALHVQLQASVLAQYAVLTGKYCQLVDADRGREDVLKDVMRLIKLSPV